MSYLGFTEIRIAMKLHAVFFLACLLPFSVNGQDSDVPVALDLFGVIRQAGTEVPIPDATVRVMEIPSGDAYMDVHAEEDGTYALTIERPGAFKVIYGAPGSMDKVIIIDLYLVPDSAWEKGRMGKGIDMLLIPEDPRLTDPVFYEPERKCSYNLETEWLEWDEDYAEEHLERLNKAYEALGMEPPGQ